VVETRLTAWLQPKELGGSHLVAVAAFIFKQFECMELEVDGLMRFFEE